MGGLLHLVHRGGEWVGQQPAQAILALPNVTAHPSTASVPITVFQYNGPLLSGFNVPIKVINFLDMQHGIKQVYRRRYEIRRSSKPKLH